MANYFDCAALMGQLTSAEMQRKLKQASGAEAYNEFLLLVNGAPVADVAPVVHGRWVVRFDGPYKRRRCYCSHCGKHNGVGGIAQNQEKPYCPNCGARMDGDAE